MKPVRQFLMVGIFLAASSTAHGQPVITNQPQAQAVAPGQTVTFTVGARGTEPLAYQWQSNPGTGFFDLANRTNATLVLTNAQPWDAIDYRVLVTNLSGAGTSAVARLYVMSSARLTNRLVIDNFDDNKLTGWGTAGATLFETNQQLTVHGYWPGKTTFNMIDTFAAGYVARSWSVQNGQTLEWRVDLMDMSEHASAADLEFVNPAIDGAYVFFKGRDFIHLNKPIISGGINNAHFLHETAVIPNSNVVIAFALTRLTPNLILTLRVLDKANLNSVLYQRSLVDTPNKDDTLELAELTAASGMYLNCGTDIQAPPWTSFFGVALHVWQYNYDGKQPAAEVTFDNLELWTYKVPTVRYVDASSANPNPPYANWSTAARVIQDAVDAAEPGDEIVATNGTYSTGGRAVGTNVLLNRVAVDKPLILRSVNGPQFTVIQGFQVPGTTNGDSAIRCVYLTHGASLSGFTLTNGATRNQGDEMREQWGGGVWCESASAMVTHCTLTDNSADWGGGAYGGTLNKCTLIGNSAFSVGGGAVFSRLNNCILTSNSAQHSGGAGGSILNNCTVTGNWAGETGGVGSAGGMSGSTLNNCIVYFNNAQLWPNYTMSILNYCCTTPLPADGVGNITNAPRFVDYAGGNLRLQSNSPCINAGLNAYAPDPTDLEDNPRRISGTVDIGAYEFQGLALPSHF